MNKDELLKLVDEEAHYIIDEMAPIEMGKLIYPNSVAVSFTKVPKEIIAEHLQRYSKKELKRGQFFKVDDKFTFFMDKIAYDRRKKKQH